MILPELPVNGINVVTEGSKDDNSFSTFSTCKACNLKQQVVCLQGGSALQMLYGVNTSKIWLFVYETANNHSKQQAGAELCQAYLVFPLL